MYVCKKCGGKNLQEAVWINANTGEYIKDVEHPLWCEDCDDEVNVDEVED